MVLSVVDHYFSIPLASVTKENKLRYQFKKYYLTLRQYPIPIFDQRSGWKQFKCSNKTISQQNDLWSPLNKTPWNEGIFSFLISSCKLEFYNELRDGNGMFRVSRFLDWLFLYSEIEYFDWNCSQFPLYLVDRVKTLCYVPWVIHSGNILS